MRKLPVVVSVLLLYVYTSSATDLQAEESLSEQTICQVVTNNIMLTASLPEKCAAGGDILLTLILTNNRKTDIQYYEVSPYFDYRLSIWDTDGIPAPTMQYGKHNVCNFMKDLMGHKRAGGTLESGKELRLRINLARLFDLTLAGDYSLYASRIVDQSLGLVDSKKGALLEMPGFAFKVSGAEREQVSREDSRLWSRGLSWEEEGPTNASGNADLRQTKENEALVKSVTVSNLVLTAGLSAKCMAGHEIWLALALENGMGTEVSFVERGPYQNYVLTVLDSDGKPVRKTRYGRCQMPDKSAGYEWLTTFRELAAGEKQHIDFNIARFFDLTQTGEYTLIIERRISDSLDPTKKSGSDVLLKIPDFKFKVLDPISGQDFGDDPSNVIY